MPASGGKAAWDTLLKMGDGGGSEVFTTIAEVGDLQGLDFSTDHDELTTHSSPMGHKEYVATNIDSGSITFPINFITSDATHSYISGLTYLWYNRVRRNFRLVFVDGTTWTCPCTVEKMTVKAPVKGKFSADLSLKVVGLPTLA